MWHRPNNGLAQTTSCPVPVAEGLWIPCGQPGRGEVHLRRRRIEGPSLMQLHLHSQSVRSAAEQVGGGSTYVGLSCLSQCMTACFDYLCNLSCLSNGRAAVLLMSQMHRSVCCQYIHRVSEFEQVSPPGLLHHNTGAAHLGRPRPRSAYSCLFHLATAQFFAKHKRATLRSAQQLPAAAATALQLLKARCTLRQQLALHQVYHAPFQQVRGQHQHLDQHKELGARHAVQQASATP